jgi:hypothetical protein
VAKTEFRVITMNHQDDAFAWESRLNEAAADDFEWVEAVPGTAGTTYVIMERERRERT